VRRGVKEAGYRGSKPKHVKGQGGRRVQDVPIFNIMDAKQLLDYTKDKLHFFSS
jgi:hypothetical protein